MTLYGRFSNVHRQRLTLHRSYICNSIWLACHLLFQKNHEQSIFQIPAQSNLFFCPFFFHPSDVLRTTPRNEVANTLHRFCTQLVECFLAHISTMPRSCAGCGAARSGCGDCGETIGSAARAGRLCRCAGAPISDTTGQREDRCEWCRWSYFHSTLSNCLTRNASPCCFAEFVVQV